MIKRYFPSFLIALILLLILEMGTRLFLGDYSYWGRGYGNEVLSEIYGEEGEIESWTDLGIDYGYSKRDFQL